MVSKTNEKSLILFIHLSYSIYNVAIASLVPHPLRNPNCIFLIKCCALESIPLAKTFSTIFDVCVMSLSVLFSLHSFAFDFFDKVTIASLVQSSSHTPSLLIQYHFCWNFISFSAFPIFICFIEFHFPVRLVQTITLYFFSFNSHLFCCGLHFCHTTTLCILFAFSDFIWICQTFPVYIVQFVCFILSLLSRHFLNPVVELVGLPLLFSLSSSCHSFFHHSSLSSSVSFLSSLFNFQYIFPLFSALIAFQLLLSSIFYRFCRYPIFSFHSFLTPTFSFALSIMLEKTRDQNLSIIATSLRSFNHLFTPS